MSLVLCTPSENVQFVEISRILTELRCGHDFYAKITKGHNSAKFIGAVMDVPLHIT